MAGVEEYKQAIDDDEDDEKASLKASTNRSLSKPRYGSTDNVYVLFSNDKAQNENKKNSKGKDNNNINPQSKSPKQSFSPNNNPTDTNPPSLTRRMSSQFVYQVERQKSVVDNIGVTEKINAVVPDEITRYIPGLNRRQSQLKLTYFCNICFSKNSIDEGFTLRRCQHQFCPDCLQGFMKNKIENGVVNLTCFHPMEGKQACGEEIDESDIHQRVSAETWEKYQKFKANLSNTYSRQCPYCDHTQNGSPDHTLMKCTKCEETYCLYHSNAHPVDMSCEEYELSIAKETRMNEMAINEMGNNVKKCPQCNFTIIKNGGCNHMNCVKCGCSFCWLCLEIIGNEELPQHYKDPSSPCKGQQFAGMEPGPPPPKWIMAVLIICIMLFCIPSTALGIAFGCICFPFVCICDCKNSDTGERQTLFETMFGCWLIWLIIFIVLTVFIPVVVFYIIWEILKAIYAVIRICIPCLPACPNRARNEQPPVVGGGQGNGNSNRGNQGLLSDVDQNNVLSNEQIDINVS